MVTEAIFECFAFIILIRQWLINDALACKFEFDGVRFTWSITIRFSLSFHILLYHWFSLLFFSGEKQDKLSIAVITERKYLREENMWSLAAPKYCSLLTNGAIILIDIRDFGRQEWRWRRGILSRLVLAGMPWKKGRCLFSLVCLMRLVFGGQGICF